MRLKAARHAAPALLLLVCASILPGIAAAENPRLVITDLEVPRTLSERERSLVRQIDLVQVIREGLLDSSSFRVLVRENKGVQAIIRERQIQDSPLAREGKTTQLGLDSAEYFLEPTLQSFSVRTSYEKLELISGMYERRDSASMQLAVRVFDAGGNSVFEETVSASASYPPREATEADKARATPPDAGPIRKAALRMARGVVDAIVARINPITVVDVQTDAFVIDRGRKNGFDEHTRFIVYGPTRVKKHPERGDEIRLPGERIGEAKLAALFEDRAELTLTSGDAKKLVDGCIVRIAQE